MQHFQRGAHFVYAIRKGTRDHPTSFHAQDWTNAFAACKHAMPHGQVNGSGGLGNGRNEAFQRRVGELLPFCKNLPEHAGLSITRLA